MTTRVLRCAAGACLALLTAAAFNAATPVQAQTPDMPPTTQSAVPMPEYTVYRTAGPITLDGVLDEESWKKAPPTASWTLTRDGGAATHHTEARVLWDDKQLYIAITVADTDVRATRTERDDDIFGEDCVEFFIMEQHNKDVVKGYLEYEINALGTQFDGFVLAPLRTIAGWDSKGWRSAVKVDGKINDPTVVDKGWTVEMLIPFFDLYGTPFLNEKRSNEYYPELKYTPQPGSRWRANFYRIKHIEGKEEFIAWSPTLRGGFHRPDRFGTLIFSDKVVGTAEAIADPPQE